MLLQKKLLLFWLLVPLVLFAGDWKQIGPFGGDVRSIEADPSDFSRVFLGTSNGQIYASTDAGRSWRWWSELPDRNHYVVDNLIVDAAERSVMYAAVWSISTKGGGGVFKSTDGGRSWKELPAMAGRSVRALAQWRKDPRVLVAGTLDGVYRSTDAGSRWDRISPANHDEIRNIESVAIDPANSNVIYAGTWHLPWKTDDGGQTWNSIKTGIIDDSDIFSIVVDWNNPRTVYASACSGIYRTDTAGQLWWKIQGIPHTARRTRVLKQDPVNASVVYAGTTEGLWKTESGGATWRRITTPRLIINDIAIDPRNPRRVLLGTDRAGVLESSDAGETFQASNDGFAHRRVSQTAHDPATGRIFAAVLHDKEYGGIFAGESGRREWRQLSAGLGDRDVFALIFARTAEGGRLLAGTGDGLFAWDDEKSTWNRVGRIARAALETPVPVAAPAAKGKPARAAKSRAPARKPQAPAPDSFLKLTVNDFFQAGPTDPLFAATSDGILKSMDGGLTWQRLGSRFNATTVASDGRFVAAGTPTGLDLSFNGGAHWFHIYLPAGGEVAHATALAVTGKTIFVATDIGLFRSLDAGATWERKGRGVPYGPVSGVRIHPADPRRVYVTVRSTGVVYESSDGGKTFHEMDRDGLVGARMAGVQILKNGDGFQLLVASAFDGLFLGKINAGASPTAGAGNE